MVGLIQLSDFDQRMTQVKPLAAGEALRRSEAD
jgi:hypothetical protein